MSRYIQGLQARMFNGGVFGPDYIGDWSGAPAHGLIVPEDASWQVLGTAEDGFWSAYDSGEVDPRRLFIVTAAGHIAARSRRASHLWRDYEVGGPLNPSDFRGLTPDFSPRELADRVQQLTAKFGAEALK